MGAGREEEEKNKKKKKKMKREEEQEEEGEEVEEKVVEIICKEGLEIENCSINGQQSVQQQQQ